MTYLDPQPPAPTQQTDDQQTYDNGAPGNSANWDGRVAVNPRTGQRLVYRVNPQGHGRFMALNYASADQSSRDRLTALTTRMSAGERTLAHARQFMDLNATAGTGGMQNDPNLAEFVRSTFAPNAQRFQSLSRNMAQDNWQPGTSGMMNTAIEQNIATQRYPNPTFAGPVNRDIYLG